MRKWADKGGEGVPLEFPVGEFAPTKVKGLSKDTKGPLAKALR